jgi:hypothetical protein
MRAILWGILVPALLIGRTQSNHAAVISGGYSLWTGNSSGDEQYKDNLFSITGKAEYYQFASQQYLSVDHYVMLRANSASLGVEYKINAANVLSP